MRLVKSLLNALLVAIALIALAGCGAPPITLAEIPIPTEVTPLERGENVMADTVASSLETALAEQGKLEMKIYSVPASMAWDSIDTFYTSAMEGGEWRVADDLRQESAGIHTTGWLRGRFAGEQGLAVAYAPDALGDGAFLIVALFSK